MGSEKGSPSGTPNPTLRSGSRYAALQIFRFRAKDFAEDFLRGLNAFEATKVDFPFQNGNSLPGNLLADYAILLN